MRPNVVALCEGLPRVESSHRLAAQKQTRFNTSHDGKLPKRAP